MPNHGPRYVIFVEDDGEAEVMMTAPLAAEDRDYLLGRAVPLLRPMSDEQYMHGPLAILHTMAKYSYILHGDHLYWCVEWEPGLLVFRLRPEGTIEWAAVRSPIPEFGGRAPDPDDDPDWDEVAVKQQRNLVFVAWDAQFDEDDRKWASFERAASDEQRRYEAALARANELGTRAEAMYAAEDRFESWVTACRANLATWAGRGTRLKL